MSSFHVLFFLVHVVKLNVRFGRVVFKSLRSSQNYSIRKHLTGGWRNAHIGENTYYTSMMPQVPISGPIKEAGHAWVPACKPSTVWTETEDHEHFVATSRASGSVRNPSQSNKKEGHGAGQLTSLGLCRDAYLHIHF